MRLIKKIDLLLIRSFLPPFVAAFFIAMFVLIMQFLWNFIDDIIGKGVSTFDLLELLLYRSFTLVPMALPIGVLLASVMVFGALSEHYELSAMKSSGISLLRIMAPVIACSVVIGLFSLYCADKLIPYTMLKFQSRLWDIRNQKPALSLEEGIFNYDFDNFTIRIGKKNQDNRHIEEVLIYDQSTSTRRQFNMIIARSGEMYISDDRRDFVMELYDGYQYREVDKEGVGAGYAFARTHFDKWTKYFSLEEFELSQTDEDLFKSHHVVKSLSQLAEQIDTLDTTIHLEKLKELHDFNDILANRKSVEHLFITRKESKEDSIARTYSPTENAELPDSAGLLSLAEPVDSTNQEETTETEVSIKQDKIVEPKSKYRAPILSSLDTIAPGADWNAVFATFTPKAQKQFISSAVSRVVAYRNNSRRTKARIENLELNKIGHIYELHTKFGFAAICIIFLFIGAPMGAIVRKGGYGYPLLVAIVFFTVFIILTIMFDKLAETRVIDPVWAAWAPCLIMLPIGSVLTFKAMNDSKMLSAGTFFTKLFKKTEAVTPKEADDIE